MAGDLVSWNNIQELMEELQPEHTSGYWRSFIDSSKVSCKAFLLHNENRFHSIALAHAVHMNETWGNFQVLLQKYTVESTGGIYVLTWKL
jgi:hypothetical protein